jgi:hypothetical protein
MSPHMKNPTASTMVLELIAQSARVGADSLDIERKDGDEEVCAMRGPIGFGIARFPSTGRKAAALRQELYQLAKRRTTVTVDEIDYNVRVRIYDSFGDDAFRVQFQPRAERPNRGAARDRGHGAVRGKPARSRLGRGA